VARIVLHKKEHLVLVRPVGQLLCMTTLRYCTEVKSPASFEDELVESRVSDEELGLAKTLIEQSTSAQFDLSQYKDEYTEKLTRIIEAKINDQEVVASPVAESPQPVLNLMEALRASVSQAVMKQGASPVQKKPAKTAKAAAAKPARPAKKTSTPLAEELAKPKRPARRKKKSG
jgi:DNA end-binding protein Ku